jgi:hypothetical protein
MTQILLLCNLNPNEKLDGSRKRKIGPRICFRGFFQKIGAPEKEKTLLRDC